MNNIENGYCRLCAELKPVSKLTDLEIDDEMREDVVSKLTRLYSPLDLRESILPKTVCLLCVDSLQRAFDFVVAVERAQIALNDIDLTQSIKKEAESSDSEHFIYEPPDEKFEENIGIKLELDIDNTDFKSKTLKNAKNSAKNKDKKDVFDLDAIPLSQLKLTWEDYEWTCAFCETQFPSVSELNNHSMKYHGACNAYRCTDCKFKKLCLDSFLIHVRRHRKYLKLSCYRCFKTFPTIHESNKHKTMHITSDFKCGGCNTNFSNSEELNKHTTEFYKNIRSRNVPVELQENNLTCLICKKKFKTKTSLNTHLLIHTDRKRDHTCEKCGKCFLHKQNLADHLMLHENRRPFGCEICKASFRNKSQLRKHVGVHDGEKPFSCEQCGKCFRLRKQLNSHSIVHTDALPHVCSYCNKGFRFKTILNQHIRQHTGVKPYSCSICQRDFTNWPNYNKHMKRRHSMDMAKKKHTPDGLYPIDPVTGQVMYPEMDKMLEWKKKILEEKKTGRPKTKSNDKLECKEKIKCEESNNN